MKALVIGAGNMGSAFVKQLHAAGHQVTVFEQAPQLAEVGAGIQMSANAMHVLNHLGLGPAIARIGVRPQAYVFKLFDTGEIIQRFVLDLGDRKTALGVEQRAVDGDAEPAGEGAVTAVRGLEAMIRCDLREDGLPGADIAAFGFEAEHE